MPKHFREENVDPKTLNRHPADERPIYEPFMTAYMAVMRGEVTPQRRKVPAHQVGIPAGYETPPELIAILEPGFQEHRRTNEEMMRGIPVLERADGSLWSYDDTAMVSLYHRHAPFALIICDVIGRDPA